ncbi:TPA: hypothetical protein N0F65_001694 [Lagenidium giganteum]|uniref:UVR domain-containing protein n=1 Tax=Lagenidium giganteum TaxID=4803 RepID=A0AAV2YJC7_9STRA|nr:TPA: hypothetical protein N0F65_001694 [Lagenidium giganteum]
MAKRKAVDAALPYSCYSPPTAACQFSISIQILKKEEGPAKGGGPPGHRTSATGATEEQPAGGGFFNLPPPVAKGGGGGATYNAPSIPNGQMGGLPPSSSPGYGRPAAGGPPAPYGAGYGPPHGHGNPMGASPVKGPGPAPAQAPGGLDMFGGMSVKTGPPPAYGGSHHGHGAPGQVPGYGNAPPAPAPAAPTGSLFSGLDFAPSAGVGSAAPHQEHEPPAQPPVIQRRKSGSRTGSFNYLDVAAAAAPDATNAPESITKQRSSLTGAGSAQGFSRAGSVSKVKKKKKTFRPGFGRQLSDESIAALQRGDLKEEEIMSQHLQEDQASSTGADSTRSSVVAPGDLSHMLPSISDFSSGSVLSGLTLHSAATATPASSGGGMLAGLTVHNPATSPKSSKTAAPASPKADSGRGSGLLAGLSVHAPSSSQSTSDASTSVVMPRHVEKPQKPPSPPPPATPEEKLLSTLRDFHSAALAFKESVQRQNEDENRILEKKMQLSNQLAQYELDLREVEAQQHQACDAEDFEKADALNASINSVRHCITLTESDIRKVDSELATFVKAKEKAFANQLRSTRGTLKELEKFREDQEAEKTALRNEFKQYEVEETEQLQFEAERIESEMTHVTANLSHLMSEKSEIDNTIEEQCKDEFATRAQLMDEKAGVEEEVRELERLLRLKQERVREIQGSIDKAEHDIDVVRSRFARQLKRIADREDTILKTKAEVEGDAEQLKVQKKEFNEKIHSYEADIASISKRIVGIRKEMRVAVILTSVLETQETRREQSLIRKKQQTAELSSLSDAAAIAEQSFTMLRKQHDELEKSLSIHRNAIASAEAMIPRLEQEKKEAAAQRNFKEAARISKDIKALEKDRATAEEMVEVVEMELQDLKERISKREVECEQKKAELSNVERQLELATLQELWKEAKHLRSCVRKMEKCKSEGVAADNGVDFRSSALLLVNAELDACMMQVTALEKKYDTSDPNPDDDESEEDSEELDEDEAMDLVHEHAVPRSSIMGRGDGDESGEIDIDASVDGATALEDINSKLSELESLIEKATDNEEYELAARLDEKIESLKRRQHSIMALASKDFHGDTEAEDEDEDKDEDDDEQPQPAESEEAHPEPIKEHSHPTHEGEEKAELAEQLAELQARIVEVEGEIETATENEDFDAAAELDEELNELREEEKEILALLSTNGDDKPSSGSASGSMFEGLGVKASAESEPTEDEAPSEASMFQGLQLGSPRGSASGAPPSTESSMFGGMQLRTGTDGNDSETTPASPDQSIFGGLQVNAASPRKSSLTSPAAVASPEPSMFGGLELAPSSPRRSSGGASNPATSPRGSLFGGLTVASGSPRKSQTSSTPASPRGSTSATAVVEHSDAASPPSSMFGGLELSTSAPAADIAAADEAVAIEASRAEDDQTQSPSASAAATVDSSSIFGGLSVNSSEETSANEDPNASMFGGLTLNAPPASANGDSEPSILSSLSLASAASVGDAPAAAAEDEPAEEDEPTAPVEAEVAEVASEAVVTLLLPRKSLDRAHAIERNNKLGVLSVALITYFNVCGGPWGSEPIVSSCGPLVGIIAAMVFPFIWCLPLALSFAELFSAFPTDSSFCTWVGKAFGRPMGFFVGYWSWVGGVIDNAIYPCLMVDSIYAVFAGPEENTIKTVMVPLWMYMVRLSVATVFMLPTIYSIDAVGRFLLLLGVLVIMPFIVLIVMAVPQVDPSNWFVVRPEQDWSQLVSVLYWCYSGFDAAGAYAGEIDQPNKTYPRAMMLTVSLVALTYSTPFFSISGVNKPPYETWADGYYPVIAEAIGGASLRSWFLVCAILGNSGVYIAKLTKNGFQLAGMADLGMAPRFFIHRTASKGVPQRSILLSFFIISFMAMFDFNVILGVDNFLSSLSCVTELCAVVRLRFKLPDLVRPYKVNVSDRALLVIMIIPFCLGTFVMINEFTKSSLSMILNTLAIIGGVLSYYVLRHSQNKTTQELLRIRLELGVSPAVALTEANNAPFATAKDSLLSHEQRKPVYT